jgi:hypothetical protein
VPRAIGFIITKDRRHGRRPTGWVTGRIAGASREVGGVAVGVNYFEAKVQDEPSDYGIDGGRVIKLWVGIKRQKGTNERLVARRYEREYFWAYDHRPSTFPETPERTLIEEKILPRLVPFLDALNRKEA